MFILNIEIAGWYQFKLVNDTGSAVCFKMEF
jgi:hypothetical protein